MDKPCLTEKLKEEVLSVNFDQASNLIYNVDPYTLSSIIGDLACETENISVYSFLVSLLIKKEDPHIHAIAAGIFIVPFFYIEGANNVAFYHAQRAVELCPKDYRYKELLLSFHNIPEPLVSKKEALKLAQDIIKVMPDNTNALDIIKRYQKNN